ncbi:lipase family protein [Limibacter armeniacum]|uniref:alpha/beta hydrolase family protein n=1 Tax=Limibacter armeniacum TaxID=466084 RepID=UPI002FE50EB1
MNYTKNIWILLLLLAPFFQSCSDDDGDDPQPINEKLVSYEKAQVISETFAEQAAQIAGYGDFTEFIENDTDVYAIIYKTTYQGNEIQASGLVSVPKLSDPSPLIMVHRGTIFSDTETPSENPLSPYALFGTLGYISFTPDLIGFGASKDVFHPYFEYEHTVDASLDMLVAVKELLNELEITYDPTLFITGYSQGGYSAMATLKGMEDSSDDFGVEIGGVAAGAGGYDINKVMDEIVMEDTYSSPGFLTFVVQSYHETYNWDTPYSEYFNEPYAQRIAGGLLEGANTQEEVNAQLSTELDTLFTAAFLAAVREGTEEQVSGAMATNSVADWAPQSPLRLYHSPNDESVPYASSTFTYDLMVSNGAEDIDFKEIGGDNHADAAAYMLLEGYLWIESRRAELIP